MRKILIAPNELNFHEKMWIRVSLVRLTLIPLTSQGFLQVGTQILQESSSALHLYGSYNFLKIIIWSAWDRNVWSWASESLVERPFHIRWILFRESSPYMLPTRFVMPLACAQTPIISWWSPEKRLSEGTHMENVSWNSSFSSVFRAKGEAKGRSL